MEIAELISFIKEVAATQPPQHLSQLLRILNARGESILSPGAKQGLMPLAIPLSQSNSASFIFLSSLRMEMPVVEVRKHGVWLLAKNVDQFIHRILVEEDANNGIDELFHAASDAGEKLYRKGDFSKSQIMDVDVYLLRKVSAMLTDDHFRSVYFPMSWSAKWCSILRMEAMVGRNVEAKDAARGALKSPWWTLGCKYHEVACIAEWKDEQIEYRTEKMTEEGRREDLNKGKPAFQIALDEAAFLLDLASVEGTWDSSLERIAECYKEAGLHDMARFVQYKD
ncbi:hypothetical protein GOBAR_DD01858 [Gossypium barbadense]|nr:hypothetical protein GOBAR_DD01858 [Gossypium barbadense]